VTSRWNYSHSHSGTRGLSRCLRGLGTRRQRPKRVVRAIVGLSGNSLLIEFRVRVPDNALAVAYEGGAEEAAVEAHGESCRAPQTLSL
jgi:hypothetical protein